MDNTVTINNVPRAILYARTEREIFDYLDRTAKAQNLTADDICMILRDVNLEYERRRADEYTSTVLRLMAKNQLLEQENTKLKEISKLFEMEDPANDKPNDKS